MTRGNPRQSSPDLVRRLLGVGAKPPQDGQANYYAPLREVADALNKPMAISDASCNQLALTLARMLNNAIGINVRLPSHIAPPFRSIQWLDSRVVQVGVGLAIPNTNLSFNGTSGGITVPEGMRGVLVVAQWFAWPEDQDQGAGISYQTVPVMNIAKNGIPQNGWGGIQAAMQLTESVTIATGASLQGTVITPFEAPGHINLEAGDTIQFATSTNLTGVILRGMFRVAGWLYPIEVQGENIVGTVADRGNSGGLVRYPKDV